MKVKRMMKRGISVLIAAALALGPASDMMPGGGRTEAAGVEYSVKGMGANVLPAQLESNDQFLSIYVRHERGNSYAQYNCNSMFTLTNSANLNKKKAKNKGISTLNPDALYMHEDNKSWRVEYSWFFDSGSLVKEMWNAGDLQLNFYGNLYSDSHTNVSNHWDSRWDRVRLRIYGINSAGGMMTNIIDKYSGTEKKQDQTPQEYKASFTPKANQNAGLKFWAGSADCECGSSGVSDSAVYLVDQKAPTVTRIYAAADEEGENRLTEHKGLKAGEQVFFFLDFSENIRFADNQSANLQLALDCAWKDTDQSVVEKVTADLISVKENRMVFRMTVPEKLDGRATDIYVTAVSGTQEWVGKGSSFAWVLLDKDGRTFQANAVDLPKIGSRITDMAGNAVNWSGSVKTLSEKAYLDAVQPECKKITLSGSKINSNSTVSKDENGSWPADLDRSAVYAGPGDRIGFRVSYSDRLTGIDLQQVSAKLNIVDGNGSPVILKAKEIQNVKGKDVFGTDAGAGYVSELIFEEFQVAGNMQYVQGESGPIRILEIEGMKDVTDIAGNPLNAKFNGSSQTVEIAALQQQYLDVQAPAASASMSMEADKYNPLGEAGLIFTIPVTVNDNEGGSGVLGKNGYFALLLEGSGRPYYWYMDMNPEIDENAKWNAASSGADFDGADRNKFPQIDGESAIYLHISLVEGRDYGYTNDGCFEGTLAVETVDYAGNSSSAAFPLRHRVDVEKPVAQKTGYTASYQDGAVHMEAGIRVTDNFGVASIQYSWEGDSSSVTVPVNAESAGENVKSMDFTAECNVSAAAGSSGERTLHIIITDVAGNSLEWSETYSYSVGKAKSIYSVSVSSPEDPVIVPNIRMTHPEDVESGASTERVDSMLLIEIGEGAYYGCLPDYGENVLAQNVDILDQLPYENNGGSAYPYAGKWYSLTGTVNAEANEAELDYEVIDPADVWQIGKFLREQYRAVRIYFIASPALVKSDGDAQKHFSIGEGGDGSIGDGGMGTIDSETLYIAGSDSEGVTHTEEGNPIYYAAQITDAVDGEGNSILDRLLNPAAGNAINSVEGVGFVLEINNQADEGKELQYGLSLMDFDQSTYKVIFMKDGSNVYTGTLSPVAGQMLTIPKDAANRSGWYQIQVEIVQKNGVTQEISDGPYMIDGRQSDLSVASYEKVYLRPAGDGCADDHTVTVKSENYSGEQPDTVKVGLAELPEGWSLSQHQLSFHCGYGESIENYTDNRRIRVYSKNDPEGEDNAPWYDFSGSVLDIAYTPVLALANGSEGIQWSAYYGERVLPLSEGENHICLQVINSNGTMITKELRLLVSAEGPGNLTWNEDITPTLATLTPNLTTQQKLDNLTIGILEKSNGKYDPDEETGIGIGEAEEYRYVTKESRNGRFYIYDTYGNLSASSVEITGVDGRSPFIAYDNSGVAYGDVIYHMSTCVVENSISQKYLPEMTLTFDEHDSAILLGKTGNEMENNTEKVSVRIPVSLEGMDENGECPMYEWDDPSNQGIFRTQISNYSEAGFDENGIWKDGQYVVDIWGICPYDDVRGNNGTGEKFNHDLTLTFVDSNGNSTEETVSVALRNEKPEFMLAICEKDAMGYWNLAYSTLTEDGYVGIYSQVPIAAVHSYGAGKPVMYQTSWPGWDCQVVTLPMIHHDGTYQVEYTDLFGNMQRQELEVTLFENSDLIMDYSETEYTNKDVIVTASLVSGEDSIVSISAVDETGAPLADGVLNENAEDKDRCTSAYVIMPENGKVTVETVSQTGEKQTYVRNILNIDKELEPAGIVWLYNGRANPVYVTEGSNTVEGEVTVILSCEEDVTGVNGPLSYTFKQGSKAGDKYTFVYMDRAGNTGELTAALPVDIAVTEPPVVENDTTAPEYTLECYGMRNEQYTYLGNYIYSVDEDDDAAEIAVKQQKAGETANYVFDGYPAQGYRMIFDIVDESSTKVIVKQQGANPPVSYSDTSDAVNGVSITGSSVTISENYAAFDIYVVDSFNNITPVKGLEVHELDNEAPQVKVDRRIQKDEDGIITVRSVFYVENDEQIIMSDSRLGTMTEIKEADDSGEDHNENDNETKNKYVVRYYFDTQENGKYEFRYWDIYGNSGSVMVQVAGLDQEAPAVLGDPVWYGTIGNKAPEDVGDDDKVNHSVTATLTVSKAVSKVELYRYDESAEDKMGDLPEGVPISASFVGQKVTVTYENNVEDKIIVKIYASGNGKSVTQDLEAVNCIDVIWPEVTILQEELSEGKRRKTYTFETSEETILAESGAGNGRELSTVHTWTADQNGEVTLHFTDQAGNMSEYRFTVAGIDDRKLTLSYSTSADGSGSGEDVSALNLKAGDPLYISANKEVSLELGNQKGTADAGIWTAFTMPAETGFHILKATDSATGKVSYTTLLVNLADAIPPVISFNESMIMLKEGTALGEMRKLAYEGVSVTDNEDTITEFEVSGIPESAVRGIYTLTYSAKDRSGNEGTASRILYITGEDVPMVSLNGQAAQPFGTTIIREGSLRVVLDGLENQPVLVKIKSGIKTGGQMKYDAVTLQKPYVYTIPASGFYTLYIRTQDRQEMILYIYAEEQ